MRGSWAGVVAAASIAVAIGAAYSNALHGPFVFDDWHTLEQNPHIRSLTNVPRFFVDADTTTVLRENKDLRPLLVTTFAVNYAVSGSDTWSYHIANLVLHWLAVLLVFRIVRDHLWLGSDAVAVAATAALIVALHPLNTSAVNYLSARSALLTTVFYLAAFDAALRRRGVLASLLAAGAMLTKSIAVTLPFVVLAHALMARRQHGTETDTPEKQPPIPWRLVATLAAIAVAGIVYRRILLPPWVIESAHQADVTPWIYFMTGWSAYLYYLRLFLWPDALVIDRLDYPWARSFLTLQAAGSLVALVALAVATARIARRAPALGFAALWVLVTLAPESSLFPLAEAVNEHRPYLAMLGLATCGALGLRAASGAIAARAVLPARATFAVIVALVAISLGVATFQRNVVWRNDRTLWIDATIKAPRNARAWLNAGRALMRQGDDRGAREMLMTAHRLDPCYAYIQINLSVVDRRAGDLAGALRWADEGARCNPGLALTHFYRGDALERLGRADDALAAYRRTTAIDAVHTDAWEAQGRLLEQRKAWADAASAYDRALAADATRVTAAMPAGVVYLRQLHDPATAAARFRSVLAIAPTHYGAHYQLAVALLALGRRDEALAVWRAFVPMAESAGDRVTLAGAPPELRSAETKSVW